MHLFPSIFVSLVVGGGRVEGGVSWVEDHDLDQFVSDDLKVPEDEVIGLGLIENVTVFAAIVEVHVAVLRHQAAPLRLLRTEVAVEERIPMPRYIPTCADSRILLHLVSALHSLRPIKFSTSCVRTARSGQQDFFR